MFAKPIYGSFPPELTRDDEELQALVKYPPDSVGCGGGPSRAQSKATRLPFPKFLLALVSALVLLSAAALLSNLTTSFQTLPTLGGAFPSDPDAYSLSFPSVVTPSGAKHALKTYQRAKKDGPPREVFPRGAEKPLPTNRWYQNLLIGLAGGLNDAHKAYTVPYVIDCMMTSLPLALDEARGIRLHWSGVSPSGDKIIQVQYDAGAGIGVGVRGSKDGVRPKKVYEVGGDPGPLGLDLEWKGVGGEGESWIEKVRLSCLPS